MRSPASPPAPRSCTRTPTSRRARRAKAPRSTSRRTARSSTRGPTRSSIRRPASARPSTSATAITSTSRRRARSARVSVDPGSVNFGESGPDGRPLGVDFVYRNSPRDVAQMVEHCARLGLGPSVACFEPGFLRATVAYHRAGLLPPGALVKLYFMERGYLAGGEPHFGVPPIREALDLYLAMLGDSGLPWAVAVLGGSLLDSPLAGWALERGGHLRVGLEDFPDAKSNRDAAPAGPASCSPRGR